VLSEGVLSPKSTYTLSLTAVNARGIAGTSSLTFSTSGPPTSGFLAISPSAGFAVTSEFSFSALNWVDDDDAYPLKYSFFYAIGNAKDLENVLKLL
jgi:hypothetical protein